MSDPMTWKKDLTPKNFFNPLNNDLIVELLDEDNKSVEYTIPFYKSSTYPTYLADRFIERIIDAIIEERELGYITPEKREELRQEVAR